MTGWVMSEHGVPDSRLIVISRVEDHITPNGCKKVRWLCKCNCPEQNTIISTSERIKKGVVKSCGCLKNESNIQTIKKYQHKGAEIRKKYNQYTFYETYGVGVFSNCDDVFYFDLEDYDLIKDYCWYKQYGYARSHAKDTNRDEENISMHELIGCKNHDHINRNRADNRKENLRPATAQENARNKNLQSNNTSGVAGVCWKKDKKKWKAYIVINKKQIHLGYFDDKDEAIKARLAAEQKYFKEFAPQQDLYEKYDIAS